MQGSMKARKRSNLAYHHTVLLYCAMRYLAVAVPCQTVPVEFVVHDEGMWQSLTSGFIPCCAVGDRDLLCRTVSCDIGPCRVVSEPGGPSCPVVCVRWRPVQVAGLHGKGRQQRLSKEQSVQILANHMTKCNWDINIWHNIYSYSWYSVKVKKIKWKTLGMPMTYDTRQLK